MKLNLIGFGAFLEMVCVTTVLTAGALAPTISVAAQRSTVRPSRILLDVVVFYAQPPLDSPYSPAVRGELDRFLQRTRSYRPRPRPAGLGGEMRMVYAAREGYEAKLVAVADPGAERLAQQYVDELRPCYEWERFHDCPEREAMSAERYETSNPNGPFREFLLLLAAHRWLCAAEGYDYEKRPQDATRSRRAFQAHLTSALTVQSLLIRTAAQELKARGRCYGASLSE